ncbi:Auxin-responsive protein [Actinidia chinensis var. chinensis]|uniref:Auxin-responsive protein n=1 Tax=Actinidia chinensis var. chinensis TaxID=1590841 RepID=A0A2R6PU10_ACTCC|nr:Auxin-responsive protein [Actinidia chinensis var. chinensis]
MKGAKLTKLRSALKKLPSIAKLDSSVAAAEDSAVGKLHPVLVGKSRRRYLVSSEIVDHPLFQELVDRSNGSDGMISVACEVVMFDHLLWMLENADSHSVTVDDLVEFYSY